MNALSILLVSLIGQSTFAAHAPSLPRTLMLKDARHSVKMTLDFCVQNKAECIEYMNADPKATSYITIADDEGCVSTHDDDKDTVGCYLK